MKNFIMDTGTSEDEFKVTCSDEELAADFTENYAGWEPKPETITWLFETIAKEKTLPLNWKWEYGKRPPTPLHEESDSEEEEEDEKVEITGFDFDDEPSAPKLTPRRAPGTLAPKGSAKKKTTNFDNILESVRRQRKLEAREKNRSRKDKK